MRANKDGIMPYKNIFATREGVTGLWVGMNTFYFRCAGHIMIVLLVQDFTTEFLNNLRGKKNI